jgi:chromosome segregation ATPase
MHRANILYGVTMGDEGVSRLISLKFEEAAKVVRQ